MPWWAAANEGVSGWLYFEVSEWRYATDPSPHVVLPPEVPQPNLGFADVRLNGSSRVRFNVNKYYGNVYGGGTIAGDGIFLYPGQEGPLSSARLETWRDGSEDYELFARLSPTERLPLIRRLVRSIAGWDDDATLLEQVRREAAAALLAVAAL